MYNFLKKRGLPRHSNATFSQASSWCFETQSVLNAREYLTVTAMSIFAWDKLNQVDSKASSTSPRRSPTLVSQRKTQPNSDEVDTTKKLTHIPVGNSPRSCPERLALYLQAVVQVVSEREGVSVVGGGERSSSLITSLQLYLDEVVPGWDNINMSGEACNNMVHACLLLPHMPVFCASSGIPKTFVGNHYFINNQYYLLPVGINAPFMT